MRTRRVLVLLLMVCVPSCSKSSGDTTIINQDLVPADPPVKAWRIPEMLGTANATSASASDVQFDSAGNALAVFMQSGIWARWWTPAGGWSDIERISDSSAFGAAPKIAMDGAGNALVVYQQLDDPSGGFETSIWWNRYTAGLGWETPQLLESDFEIAGDVQISGNAVGNAIAVWNSYDGASSNIHYNRYVAGVGWEGAAPLADGPEASGTPRVGMDASGNAMAVWIHDSDIYWSRNVSGSWSAIEPLELAVEVAFNPELAVNASGRAMALWVQFDGGSNFDLWSRVYDPAAGWGTTATVESDSAPVNFSQVIVDASGIATAIWSAGTDELWSARNSPGSGWTSSEMLGPLKNSVSPELAVSASGSTGVVWQHSDGFRSSILFATHSGGPWSPPEFVEFAEEDALQPALAMDANGNAVAIWTYYEGVGGFRTWANWYE